MAQNMPYLIQTDTHTGTEPMNIRNPSKTLTPILLAGFSVLLLSGILHADDVLTEALQVSTPTVTQQKVPTQTQQVWANALQSNAKVRELIAKQDIKDLQPAIDEVEKLDALLKSIPGIEYQPNPKYDWAASYE